MNTLEFNGLVEGEDHSIPLHEYRVRILASQPFVGSTEDLADAIWALFPVCEDGDVFVEKLT